jgi:hypothetical protein
MRLLGEERDARICVVTLNAAPLRAVPTAGFPSLAMAKIGGGRQNPAQCSLPRRVEAPALAMGISIVMMSMYSTKVTFDFVFRERNARIGFTPCQV